MPSLKSSKALLSAAEMFNLAISGWVSVSSIASGPSTVLAASTVNSSSFASLRMDSIF